MIVAALQILRLVAMLAAVSFIAVGISIALVTTSRSAGGRETEKPAHDLARRAIEQHHLFAPNAINRYSLGTKNKTLQHNADGSLTLYVQAELPAAAQRSNCLPAPRGDDFSLYVRANWPKAAVTDGSWTPPSVIRAGDGTSRALQ